MSSVCQRLELGTTAPHTLPSFSGFRKDGCSRISFFSGTSCRQGLGAARVRSWRLPRVVYAELGFVNSDLDTSLVFNQTAPPVGTVFPNSTSEVKSGNVLEEGAAFVRGKVEKKVAKFNQALEYVEDFVGPTPFAPAEGAAAVFFICIRFPPAVISFLPSSFSVDEAIVARVSVSSDSPWTDFLSSIFLTERFPRIQCAYCPLGRIHALHLNFPRVEPRIQTHVAHSYDNVMWSNGLCTMMCVIST